MRQNFTALMLLLGFFSFAQITFEKGYYINNSGKRTDCYIENLDWRNNPTSFNYKLNLSDTDVKIENIMGVSEFGIDNLSMFKRFDVNIERSQSVTSYLQKSKSPVWKSEIVFLHALVTGDANLYAYVDANITKYFYETKTKPIEQLVYIRYIDESSGLKDGLNSYSESIQENNQFRQQLLNNVKCGTMTEDNFKKLEYNKNALIKHFVAYNSCDGSKKTVNYNAASEDNRETFALRIIAGAYSGKIAVSDPNNYYNMSTDVTQLGYRFGFDAEYILPFNKGTWSLFINPSYQTFNPSKTFSSPISNPGFSNNGEIVNYNAKVDYSTFEIPFGVRHYFFVNKGSRIFVNLSYVIVFSGSGNNIQFTNNNNLANANETIPITSRNNIALGLGYAYRRFSGEIRYGTPRQVSNYLQWDVKYSSLGFNLGYKVF